MATEVILPKVDMVMETGTFVEWLKQEGDPVKKGEPLFVISTDKAAMEIESPATGILCGLRANPNQVIPVTSVLAFIVAEGESLPGTAAVMSPVTAPVKQVTAQSKTYAATVLQSSGMPGAAFGKGKPRATPVARRMASEMGLDLRSITGRGQHGRIHKADILLAAEQQAVKFVPPSPDVTPAALPSPSLQIPLPAARQKQVVPLAGPRKIIAERMAYSAATTPHITLTLSIDMSEASRMRDRVQPEFEKAGHHLSFTAIIARTVAFVLRQHPYLNASLAGDNIILWDDVHLGIAASLQDYLIVPVIRESQNKTLREIVAELKSLVERTRTRRLSPAEMSGSTFTISNLGMYGIESFISILNPPEAAILSVGKIREQQVQTQAGVAWVPVMSVTVCADHRILDGVMVARFLADLKTTLENPYLLI
jgi:pyruvate dehydrogenase E2 component (dihydrolipoamide acetyltransferase)